MTGSPGGEMKRARADLARLYTVTRTADLTRLSGPDIARLIGWVGQITEVLDRAGALPPAAVRAGVRPRKRVEHGLPGVHQMSADAVIAVEPVPRAALNVRLLLICELCGGEHELITPASPFASGGAGPVGRCAARGVSYQLPADVVGGVA